MIMISKDDRNTTIFAATGSGLVGGIFFAFSTFVMRALGCLDARSAIRAMQAINREAPTPMFMVSLFGTALLSLRLGRQALSQLESRQARYELAGAALYLTTVVLTMVYHVPRNEALGRVDPDGATAAEVWAQYLPSWTTANHIAPALHLLPPSHSYWRWRTASRASHRNHTNP